MHMSDKIVNFILIVHCIRYCCRCDRRRATVIVIGVAASSRTIANANYGAYQHWLRFNYKMNEIVVYSSRESFSSQLICYHFFSLLFQIVIARKLRKKNAVIVRIVWHTCHMHIFKHVQTSQTRDSLAVLWICAIHTFCIIQIVCLLTHSHAYL